MNQSNHFYLGDLHKRLGVLKQWERHRNRKQVHWLMECFAESLGVFLYCFPGIGANLGYVLGGITQQQGISSVFQIGFGYALGIMFALGIAASTSGGHFNPAVTIVHVIFRGFPVSKALRYIVAQIFGGYVACMLAYYQWRSLIHEMIDGLVAAGGEASLFTPNGPPGAFGFFTLPGASLGTSFLNEFVSSFYVAIVIWAANDPTNMYITPAHAAPCIALSYAAAIWGFSPVGVVMNTARDLGGRLWVLTIWGSQASGGKYAAISALTNIPATLFAVTLYEVFLVDSDRLVTPQALEFTHLTHGNRRFISEHVRDGNSIEQGYNPDHDSGKASITALEYASQTK